MASSPGLVSADELATALKVLRAAAPPYDASKSSHVDVEGSEVVALRKLLMPAIHTILKRERHRQRQAAKAQATHGQSEAKTEGDGTTERLDALSKVESGDGVVKLDATVLSRPLYACPVCFLSISHKSCFWQLIGFFPATIFASWSGWSVGANL